MKEISTFKCIPLIPQRFSVVKYLCWILSKYFSNGFLFRYRSVYILNQYWIFFMFMIKLKQTNKAVTGEKIILFSIPGATSIPSFEHFGWNVHFVKKKKKKNVVPFIFVDLSLTVVIPLLLGKKEKLRQYFGDLVFRNKLSIKLLILVDAKRACCSAKILYFRQNISQENLR